MKHWLYAVMFAPVLLTAVVFCWILTQEQKLVQAMDVPMPKLGEPPSNDDPLVKKGYEIFNAKGCVYCHGPNGSGGVKNKNSQGGEIPSLTKVSEGYTKEELKNRILAGVREISQEDPAGPVPPLYMPSWKGHLTDEELESVAAFLYSLAPKGGADEF